MKSVRYQHRKHTGVGPPRRGFVSVRRGFGIRTACETSLNRLGMATLDYVLVMGAVLPMVAMSYYYATKIIRAVYQMTCALVTWPFM